jgi:alanyl-tRNA synthetase
MWEILCRERDLRRKKPKKLKTREKKYVELNNIVYMELYSGAKKVNEKDLKTKYLRSKNREFTVLPMWASGCSV